MFSAAGPSVERGGRAGDWRGAGDRGGKEGLGVPLAGRGGGERLAETAELVDSDRRWAVPYRVPSSSMEGVAERDEGSEDVSCIFRGGGAGGGGFFPIGGGGGFLVSFFVISSSSVANLSNRWAIPLLLVGPDPSLELVLGPLKLRLSPPDEPGGSPNPIECPLSANPILKLGVDGVLRGVAALGVGLSSSSSSPCVPDIAEIPSAFD